jgi:TonB family protein
MSKLILFIPFAVACATTSSGLTGDQTERGPRAKVSLGAPPASTQRAYPELVDPAVPSIDRLAHSIRARLGAAATAELDLCTTPAGRVTRVALARSSSFEAFDAALVHDAEGWQFGAMPGPDSVQSCRRTTVTYRPH